MTEKKNMECKDNIEKKALHSPNESKHPEAKSEAKSENKAESKIKAEANLHVSSQCEQQLEELTDLLKRTQANFENYKKQIESRYLEMCKFTSKEMILQILPIVDNLALALKNSSLISSSTEKLSIQNGNLKEFQVGVELIYTQLKKMLEEQGVKEIACQGKYDPYLHEALMKVESELPENTILEVFQKGYILHGQVIQHAKVKLSAGQKKEMNKIKQNNNQ